MNRPENATCATCPFAHFNGEVETGRCYGIPGVQFVAKTGFCGLHPLWQYEVHLAACLSAGNTMGKSNTVYDDRSRQYLSNSTDA